MNRLSVADAKGLQPVALPGPLELADQLGEEDGPRGAEGVAKGACACEHSGRNR